MGSEPSYRKHAKDYAARVAAGSLSLDQAVAEMARLYDLSPDGGAVILVGEGGLPLARVFEETLPIAAMPWEQAGRRLHLLHLAARYDTVGHLGGQKPRREEDAEEWSATRAGAILTLLTARDTVLDLEHTSAALEEHKAQEQLDPDRRKQLSALLESARGLEELYDMAVKQGDTLVHTLTVLLSRQGGRDHAKNSAPSQAQDYRQAGMTPADRAKRLRELVEGDGGMTMPATVIERT